MMRSLTAAFTQMPQAVEETHSFRTGTLSINSLVWMALVGA